MAFVPLQSGQSEYQCILDALERGGFGPGKPNGKETTFRCPVHERDSSHKPSLDVSQGRDGKALLQCRSQHCKAEDIFRALNIGPPTNGQANGKQSRRIVATYPYCDERGAILFEAVRYEPKDFRQRKPDGKGGWEWSISGCRKVPYRLPELLAAPKSEPVFIVEGEKDVDALRALGFVATCNPMGAGKWKHLDSSTVADALRDRRIVILPDNDEPGKNHANDVCQAQRTIATEIIVLELPGLPPKGDVSDWLAAGGTADELRALVESQGIRVDLESDRPYWQGESHDGPEDVPPPGEPSYRYVPSFAKPPDGPRTGKPDDYRFKFNPITSRELAEGDFRIDWLVSWKLAAMQPGVIAAFAKGMKTSIAIDLVVSLGSGTPFLGQFGVPRKVRVAILSGESGKYAIQETARRICRAKGIELADVDALWGFDLPQLGDALDLDELARGLKAAGVEVVIIDPLYLCLLSGMAIGPDASKNVYAMGPLLLAISRRCLEIGVTPILIHHSNRSVEVGKPMELQHISGAGVAEFARQWILLNRDTPYQGDGIHSIWMNIGGSCGQGGLHLLRIDEGTAQDEGGRHWDVSIQTASEAVQEKRETKKSKRETQSEDWFKADLERCYELVCQLCEAKPNFAVKRQIRAAGNWGDDRADMLIQRLLLDGRIEAKTIKPKKGKGGYRKPVEGYCPMPKKEAETL